MTDAVWTLIYTVADDERARYLDWFHGVHVPEKLARPGYAWAAHYEHALDVPGRRGYFAFFGGDATRVFYDPSPAQLKSRQDALTREMMALRIGGRSAIYCEEWRRGGTDRTRAAIDAAAVRLACIDARGHDEALEAWCAQEHLAAVCAAPGCTGARKWLASSDGPRHAIVQEFASLDACAVVNDAPPTAWAAEVAAAVAEPFGPPRIGRRIWPEPR